MRRRPQDRADGDTLGQAPVDARRQPGIAGVDPVRVPRRVMPDPQADVEALAGRDRSALGDEFDGRVVASDRLRADAGRGVGEEQGEQHGDDAAVRHPGNGHGRNDPAGKHGAP